MHTLRILHVSDLHLRGSNEPEAWRRRRVLGAAWQRNLEELLQDGPFDLVCFTGDLAFSGDSAGTGGQRPGEYDEATEFFEDLLQRVGRPPERLFLVPGNHDIDRTVSPDAWSKLRDQASQVDPLQLSRWFAGRDAPFGFDNGLRDQVLERGGAYRRWLEHGLNRSELLPANSPHGRLGYRQTLYLPEHPFAVHMIGLDSSWLAGNDSDSGHLRLTDDQVARLTLDENGNALPGFRLALIHHPLSDLADMRKSRDLLPVVC